MEYLDDYLSSWQNCNTVPTSLNTHWKKLMLPLAQVTKIVATKGRTFYQNQCQKQQHTYENTEAKSTSIQECKADCSYRNRADKNQTVISCQQGNLNPKKNSCWHFIHCFCLVPKCWSLQQLPHSNKTLTFNTSLKTFIKTYFILLDWQQCDHYKQVWPALVSLTLRTNQPDKKTLLFCLVNQTLSFTIHCMLYTGKVKSHWEHSAVKFSHVNNCLFSK